MVNPCTGIVMSDCIPKNIHLLDRLVINLGGKITKNDGIAYLCSEYIKIENNDEEVYESYVAGLRVFVEPAGEGAAGYS